MSNRHFSALRRRNAKAYRNFGLGFVFVRDKLIFLPSLLNKNNLRLLKNNLIALICGIAIYACNSPKAEVPALKAQSSTVKFVPKSLPPQDSIKYHNAVQEVLDKNLLRGRFNGSILVAKDGAIVYEQYVGTKDPRIKTKDSITAETSFQIASTGKTITSAAVLKLWEEGKLDINDSVSKYFPGFPYAGVTVKTLLDHRSGLPNYLYYFETEKGKWDRKKQATNADVLNSLLTWNVPKAANADRRFQYCNTNFVLLALIVEKVSGMPFPEFLKKTFFEPLGMNHSFVISPNEQAGHIQSFQPNNALWSLDFSDGPYGDKNIFSTPRDLLIWDQALTEGKVLSPKTLEAAYTPYSNEKPGIHNYGLGWRMLLYPNSKKIIYHNGHWHGFNIAFARLPEEKATIIIFTNRFNPAVYSTAKKLYDVFGNYDGKQDEGEE
ncbi:beta-lactamase family protein [Flavisolibacter ginsenosidimutans]|uniref:Beta-lactamase family protein n=1 Tax=Flavisolibacter ginsenosidimutans TaxID=661481 RepID=A0A5B8UFS9_9BACT|nr:beta-lactamase family protein [Flavisolibacter ginsenosidimutans]